MIHLKHEQDIAFSKIAENARVTGTILPSGLQVPKNGEWRIRSQTVVLVDKDTGLTSVKHSKIPPAAPI